MEGRIDLQRVGDVVAAEGSFPPFVVRDGAGVEIETVSRYLLDLALSDMSPLTCRSYGYDLLRWFRPVGGLGSTGSEVDVLVAVSLGVGAVVDERCDHPLRVSVAVFLGGQGQIACGAQDSRDDGG
jgi:hypothetical protein